MRKKLSMAILAALASAAASAAEPLRAGVPVSISFSGCLEQVEDGAAQPQEGETVYMAFRLYDGDSGVATNALWGRQATVALVDGVFDVELSDSLGTALPGFEDETLTKAIGRVLDGGGSTIWIGLTPGSPNNAEIAPRQRVDTVVRAVQARNARSVPADFTVDGRLDVEPGSELAVTGDAVLGRQTTYGNVTFASQPAFAGGLAVTGRLAAASLEAKTLAADTVRGGRVTAGDVRTPAVALVGAAEWSAAAGKPMDVTTARVARVEGPLTVVGPATVGTLDARQLETADKLRRNAKWSPVGALRIDTNEMSRLQRDISLDDRAETFTMYNPGGGSERRVRAVYAGSWTAPEDCIAYFQTSVSDLNGEGAAVQFYLTADVSERLFDNRTPSGIAACQGLGAKIRNVVPVVMRKGESVVWLGYNANKLPEQDRVKADDTRVEAISYRAFGWSVSNSEEIQK